LSGFAGTLAVLVGAGGGAGVCGGTGVCGATGAWAGAAVAKQVPTIAAWSMRDHDGVTILGIVDMAPNEK
jgi:hypothetical protein